ncbi:MAG: hypothetical protein RBJ76_26420 [Stenomitos frigidus ULC029]
MSLCPRQSHLSSRFKGIIAPHADAPDRHFNREPGTAFSIALLQLRGM